MIRKRLLAFFIDYLAISLYLVVLLVIGLALARSRGDLTSMSTSVARMDAIAFFTTVLPVALYFILLEGGQNQATIGKRRLGLRVAKVHSGSRLTTSQSVVRTAVKLLPWQLAHLALVRIPGWPFDVQEPPTYVVVLLVVVWVLVLGYIGSIIWSKGRRSLYDRVAGSQLVANS